jgi:hypothetical protein
MAESLCSNQFSPTYQYLQPALVQEEHCQKAYGMDSVALPSVFRRVVLGPYMVPEGGQIVQLAHTTAQPGNLGLWRRVNNLHPPGPSKGKPEGTMAHVMEQPAQDAHKFEVEQVTVAHQHKV